MFRNIEPIKRVGSYIDPGLLVVVILPILILMLNQDWIFNPPQTLDPWFYTGYFIRFKQYLTTFAGTYYGTRLGWIIPGFIAYKLFSPANANYVLHLTFYYIAIISLYLILKCTTNSKVALLTTVLMGGYAYFLLAIGWDYVDGSGIAYCLLLFLMLTWAAMFTNGYFWLFISGCTYGSLISTNIAWLIFTPTFFLYYFLLNRRYRQRALFQSIFCFLLGLICIILIFCIINYHFSRQFWFFIPSFTTAQSLSLQQNPWQANLGTWLFRATWLILPVLAFFSSFVMLVLSQIGRINLTKETQSLRVFQLCCVLSGLIMLALHIKGIPVLQFTYYASYLIPTTFLAIAAQITIILDRLPTQKFHHFSWFIGVLVAVIVLSYSSVFVNYSHYAFFAVASLSLLLFLHNLKQLEGSKQAKKVFLLGWVALVALLGIYWVANTKELWLILGNTPTSQVKVFQVQPTATESSNKYSRNNVFLATVKAQYLLKEIDPDVKLSFWYDLNELPAYRPIAATSLWGYRLISESFPDLRSPSDPTGPLKKEVLKERFKSFPRVAILSEKEETFYQAKNVLEVAGFGANLLAKYNISEANIKFTITVVEVFGKA